MGQPVCPRLGRDAQSLIIVPRPRTDREPAACWGDGRLRDAHGIDVGPDDHIYVCNRDEHEVLKLTADGTIVLAPGQRGRPSLQAPFNHPADLAVAPGAGPGQFSTPHGIWVDRPDRVLVADREDDRVQLFSAEGDCYGEWADLYHPMDIYADRAGTVYVTDQIPRITMDSAAGRMPGRGRPVTVGAHGVWGDSRGNLHLAEVGVHRVTKLSRRPPTAGL